VKTSRERLFEYIRSHGVVTVADLSQALRMTSANARHHLAILEQQGLVEVIGTRASANRGRPSLIFKVSARTQGNNLDRLVGVLLTDSLTSLPPVEQTAALRRLAHKLLGSGLKTGGNLTQRLVQAVPRLNDMQYQARWEARAESPRLILGYCPYAPILSEHPELCHLDAYLLEDLLRFPVRQTAKLARDQRGLSYCAFVIENLAEN
jgi:predicted ArsR family transcriptional regulator